MISNILNLLLIFLLILFVGFFTSSETAYLSLSKLKVRHMVEQNKKHAKIVYKLKENIDRLLTTVLIGTNFLNSLVSALATALVVKIFGGGGVGIPTLATAFFITTFGQIIPKTIASLKTEKVAAFASMPLFILEKVFFPIIWLFQGLAHCVVFIVEKIVKPGQPIVTEEELKTIIDLGEKEGTIEKDESKMLNKIIRFNDVTVSSIMKHRSFLSSVEENATYDEVIQEFLKSGYSTITVYKNERENVVGVLNYKQLLYSSAENKEQGFAGRMMSDVLYIPGTLSVLEILQKFRSQEHKFAVVLDEQGQTSGIVTMEDVMRMVFGRMTDENTEEKLPAAERIKLAGNNTFIVPGDVTLDDLNENLGLNLESDDMNTLGGWVLEQMGYLPSVGMVLVKDHILYTVEDISKRRIVSVRIKKN